MKTSALKIVLLSSISQQGWRLVNGDEARLTRRGFAYENLCAQNRIVVFHFAAGIAFGERCQSANDAQRFRRAFKNWGYI